MKTLEQNKHLEPKFSEFCLDLAGYLGYEEANLSHGQASHTSMNTDLDFHILNDVLAFDNSRHAPVQGMKRRMTPMIHRNRPEDPRKASNKSLYTNERPPRTSSTRMTPSGYESGSNRSSKGKSKGKRRVDPAQLYHDQAMSLIYSAIES